MGKAYVESWKALQCSVARSDRRRRETDIRTSHHILSHRRESPGGLKRNIEDTGRETNTNETRFVGRLVTRTPSPTRAHALPFLGEYMNYNSVKRRNSVPLNVVWCRAPDTTELA